MSAGEEVDFNPRSPNAMFALILNRLDNQDDAIEAHHKENKDVLDKILVQATATNGRVTKLESSRSYFLGWIAGASVIGGAIWTAISKLL